MAEHHGRGQVIKPVAYLMVARKERQTDRRTEFRYSPQGPAPITYFPQLSPTSRHFHHLPIIHQTMIRHGLTLWRGQSPHDSVISQ
jgi:hypothetical protein